TQWDELSFPIRNSTLRGFQICPVNNHRKKSDTQNWLRSPFMKLIGRSRIYIELNFSMRECHDLEDTICRETFKIYYAIANNGSRNPNLDENTFTTIDTVAAEDHFHPRKKGGSYINTEVVTVVMPASVDISSTGIYIALMDEGACMALISLRVYSIVCPSVTDSLAVFPETLTGQLDTSLVKVSGECVEHSRLAVPHRSLHPPVFHCTSDGKWNVQTGTCYCEAGYEPDGLKQRCQPCPRNSFKSSSGNENCTKCPGTSFTTGLASVTCMCSTGFNISSIDSDCGVCPTLPSAPLKLNVIKSTIHPGVVRLKWKKPADLGHCRNISYCAIKATTDHSNSTFGKCNHVIYHPSQCTSDTPHINVHNLHGRTNYTFTVFAINSITERHYSNSISAIKTGLFTIHQKAMGKYHPSTVRSLHLVQANYTSVDIEWNPPSYTNGDQVTYRVGIEAPHTSYMLVNITRTRLTSLNSGTSYKVAVHAINSAGNFDPITFHPAFWSKAANLSCFTKYPPTRSHRYQQRKQCSCIQHVSTMASLYLQSYLVRAFCLYIIFSLYFFILIFCRFCFYILVCIKFGKENIFLYPVLDQLPCLLNCTPSILHYQRTYVDPFSIGPIEPHKFGCETDPNRVSIGKVIGCGEFGEVFRGTLTLKVIDVAIKQLHALCQPHEQIDFLHEAKALEQFQHPNIVKLEAVVTASRPFMIVTELMANGCLGMFLRHQRAAKRFFKPVVLIRMLYGVSEGMEYLSKLGYVHRDLAARNVLINKDLVCKVADFGLTRQINDHNTCTNTKGGKISLRWAAPEAVAYQTYSEASDVWSFGVFAWEVVTYGEKPYWSLTNQQVLQAINAYRLPAPEDCPSVLHQLMLECWHRDRNARPQFSRVVGRLDTMLNQRGMLDTL
uniref:receptor protein-tyrosine kinase n=1 Tax=Ciona savignyi TaxID=51511 RepID=H2YZE8_CIOSA